MVIIEKLSRKFILPGLLLALLGGCASAPVQEMSDARQALYSAERAGAARHSPRQFHEARRLLQEAEHKLAVSAYGEARRLALDARDRAIQARETASAQLVY